MQSKSSEPHPSLFSSGRRRAVALSVHLVLPGVFLVEETYGRAEEEDTCDTHAERPSAALTVKLSGMIEREEVRDKMMRKEMRRKRIYSYSNDTIVSRFDGEAVCLAREKERRRRRGGGGGGGLVSSFDGYAVWHDREKERRRQRHCRDTPLFYF